MKKIILTLLAGLAIAVSASAQTNFGAKAGLNFFKLSTDADESTDMMTGAHLGLLAHIHINETLAFQPELVYSMQGANVDFDGDDGEFHLNYINIPLMFQYMFDNGFRLQAGPQIGILASAKAKSDGNSVDVKDQFNSLDFGIPFGVGYIFPSGFGVDARYNLGLSNVFETDDVKAQNRGLQLGVFYQFTHD